MQMQCNALAQQPAMHTCPFDCRKERKKEKCILCHLAGMNISANKHEVYSTQTDKNNSKNLHRLCIHTSASFSPNNNNKQEACFHIMDQKEQAFHF